MSNPETDILESDKLWVLDSELIRLMNMPEKRARMILRALDAQRSGFPQKQKLWGDRRYLPAVRAYFDSHYGSTLTQPQRRERA